MASNCGFSREAVRVKVKKCEGHLSPEWRKFSVDPQITSLEVLVSILAKAFDLRGDFNVSYKTTDATGQETYAVVLSDWDLDAAFLRAHNISLANKVEPCLFLRVDIKPFSESCDDTEWDSGENEPEPAQDVVQSPQNVFSTNTTMRTIPMTNNVNSVNAPSEKRELISGLKQHRFPGIFKNQMEKTLSMVQRALNLVDTVESWNWHPGDTPPLGDTEFRGLLDAVGRLPAPQSLRRRVYLGGVEPTLRRVVWKHVLNVYPHGLSGRERISYIKRKSLEYIKLRDTWRHIIKTGPITPQLSYVTSMVRKDVLRTDRHHPFYAGSDDNKNIASLFNILTTYALNHKVSYCQGMSDLASPLLVTMNDESHAYICFCALMKRLSGNFMLDGIAMTQKFTHLSEAILYYDSEFYAYLKQQQADDLLFCYRWLLLEMKREFCFEDSLRMLEVLWSSIPFSSVPETELDLYEVEFKPVFTAVPPDAPIMPSENAYTKVCALRRQSSAMNLGQCVNNIKLQSAKRMNLSLDETRNRCRLKNTLQDVKTVSLDDTALQSRASTNREVKADALNVKDNDKITPEADNRPRSVSPKKADSKPCDSPVELVSNSMTDLAKKDVVVTRRPGGHFKELKEKIAAASNSRKNIFSISLDKIEIRQEKTAEHLDRNKINNSGGKVVKNLNEFLNFNKNRLSEKFVSRKMEQNDAPAVLSGDSPIVDNKCAQKQLQRKTLEKDVSVEGSSSPDDSQEYFPMTTSMTRELRLELESLDRQVFGRDFHNKSFHFDNNDSPTESESVITEQNKNCECNLSKHSSITELSEPTELAEICSVPQVQVNGHKNGFSKESSPNDIFLWENPLHKQPQQSQQQPKTKFPTTPDEQADLEYDGELGEIFEESQGKKSITPIRLLRRTQNSNRNSDVQSSDSSESENEWKLCDAKINYQSMNNDTAKQNNEEDYDNKFAVENNHADVVNKEKLDERQYIDNNKQQAIVRDEDARVLNNELLNEKNFNETNDDSMTKPLMLPPPSEFGGGNPFLMFLCLTVLLQHRDYVMRNSMDYNEMAMHFDKMVRKHNIIRVLNQARKMYAAYLKQQNGNEDTKLITK